MQILESPAPAPASLSVGIVTYRPDLELLQETAESLAAAVTEAERELLITSTRVVVVDNTGLSSVADTVVIVVQSNKVVYVGNITMTLSSTRQGYAAKSTVTVRDQNGALVRNARVTGTWSGLTKGAVSGTTSRSGTIAFTSTRTKTRGTFTFTVTGITLSGYTYAPTRNVKTSASIATP